MHHFDIPGEKDVRGVEVSSVEDQFEPCWYRVYAILEVAAGRVPDFLKGAPKGSNLDLVADIEAVMNEIHRASIGSTENYLQIACVEGLCGKIEKVWTGDSEAKALVNTLNEALVSCYELQQK